MRHRPLHLLTPLLLVALSLSTILPAAPAAGQAPPHGPNELLTARPSVAQQATSVDTNAHRAAHDASPATSALTAVQPGISHAQSTTPTTTLANTLLDDVTGQPIAATSGTLAVYSGTLLLEEAPFITDASGTFTVTLSAPISRSVRLEYWSVGDYPVQSHAGGAAVSLYYGLNQIATRLERAIQHCRPGLGVYPLTFDADYLMTAGPAGTPLEPGMEFTVSMDINNGNLGHLRWYDQLWGVSDQAAAWVAGGTLQQHFDEAAATQFNDPSPAIRAQINGIFELGDWLYARQNASNSSSINASLNRHIATQTILRLPLYNTDNGTGGNNWHVKSARIGIFQLIAHNFSATTPYVTLRYLGDEPPESCQRVTLVNTLVDDQTGQPLANSAGAVTIYSNTTVLRSAPFASDASGTYTVTFSTPITQSVTIGYSGLPGYPDQYYDRATSPANATALPVSTGTVTLTTRLFKSTTLANTLLDDLTGQPIAATSGTLGIYSGTLLLEEFPFTTDASGTYTVTLSAPISQGVRLEYAGIAGYPLQYYGGSRALAAAGELPLRRGHNQLTTRLRRREVFLPLISR